MRRTLAAVLATLALTASPAGAQLLTFDDVPATINGYFAPIPAGYGGFAWAGFGDIGIINGTTFPTQPTGYLNGIASGTNVFYSLFGATITRATPFTFNDGFFTTAFRDDVTLTATGWRLGSQVYSGTFTIDATAKTFLSFGWTNVDELRFAISGGESVYGSSQYLVADNLRFDNAATTVIPEPGTLALLATGLALVAGARRRRARA